jgi:gas vesicle protein
MKKKNRENGNNKGGIGKVVTGLVVGSVVGATVGLLMAPASGEKTFKKIKGEVRGMQKRAKAAVGNIEDKGREIADNVKENVENTRESIVERVTSRKK